MRVYLAQSIIKNVNSFQYHTERETSAVLFQEVELHPDMHNLAHCHLARTDFATKKITSIVTLIQD